MAQFGLVLEQEPARDEHETFYLWPDLVPALQMWRAVQTQWRDGFQGRTGLDYPGVDVVMRRRGLRGRAADEMFGLLQAMERAALDVWATMRD